MTHTLPVPLDVKLMNMTASVLFLGFAVLVLASGGWWLVRHPMFAIHGIAVRGELNHNNAVTLRANVAHRLEGNFFTVDLSEVRAAFESVPWVRHAEVRRDFPSRLRVTLEEHVPVAYWGPESGSGLLNSFGEVFEANVADVDQDNLPRLSGPQGQSVEVLDMYARVLPIFEALELPVEELALNPRGSWHVKLDTGAVVELGGGTQEEVLERTRRFVRTLTQVTARYGRKASALESADLRHQDAYALRLQGITTVVPAEPGKK